MVLLGGLGASGLGEMWCDETDRHCNLPNYAAAPIVTMADRLDDAGAIRALAELLRSTPPPGD
jgi:hypothetical protein